MIRSKEKDSGKHLWFRIALINLIIAAAIGSLLRFAFVREVSWMNFKNVLHGHSHLAMLGWVYLALFVFFIHSFLTKERQQAPIYRTLFWLTQFTVVGMLLSFPVQGYGLVSIAFSTVHIILSYLFAIRFWRDAGQEAEAKKRGRPSILFARTALAFMILSTLGLWVMGPIMVSGLRHSAFYYMAVQFFLHFQFNGWFLFAVLALFFRMLERSGIGLEKLKVLAFYYLLVPATLLTYALAVAWSTPLPVVFLTNSLGVALQLAALGAFLWLLWPQRRAIATLTDQRFIFLFRVALLCFFGKILMQSMVIVPALATIAYTIRNYVIGFIHLLLLGVITTFLLGFAFEERMLQRHSRLTDAGAVLFLIGFAGSELILFLQGTMFWAALGFLPLYYEGLFVVSMLMPFGLFLILIGQRQGAGPVME